MTDQPVNPNPLKCGGIGEPSCPPVPASLVNPDGSHDYDKPHYTHRELIEHRSAAFDEGYIAGNLKAENDERESIREGLGSEAGRG